MKIYYFFKKKSELKGGKDRQEEIATDSTPLPPYWAGASSSGWGLRTG